MYFLFTFLFYIILRRKLHSPRFLFLLFLGAVLLGALAPLMSLLLGGWISVLLLLSGAVALTCLFIYKSKQENEYEEEEIETKLLSSVIENAYTNTTTEEKKESDEANNQENVDLLITELLAKQQPSTDQAAIEKEKDTVEHSIGAANREQEERLTLDDFFKEEKASHSSEQEEKNHLIVEAYNLKDNEDRDSSVEEDVLVFGPDKPEFESMEQDDTREIKEEEMVFLPENRNLLSDTEEEMPVYTFDKEEEEGVYTVPDEAIFLLDDEKEVQIQLDKDGTEEYYINLQDVMQEEIGDIEEKTVEEADTAETLTPDTNADKEIDDFTFTFETEQKADTTPLSDSLQEKMAEDMPKEIVKEDEDIIPAEQYKELIESKHFQEGFIEEDALSLKENNEENKSRESYKEDVSISDVKVNGKTEAPQEAPLFIEEKMPLENERQQETFGREEMKKVQECFAAASAAIENQNYEDALIGLKEALSYSIPFPARLMIAEEYVNVLKEMGLYKHSLEELNKLLSYLDITSEKDEQYERFRIEIVRHIKYIENITDLLRAEGKPNLPWSLIPSPIKADAEQELNA
jgi:hypothetical protein